MIKAKYRFDRPANSALGVARSSRPSTDALWALHQWSIARSGREYTPIVDEDEFLDVEIRCDSLDGDAGPQLDRFCEKYGVRRQMI